MPFRDDEDPPSRSHPVPVRRTPDLPPTTPTTPTTVARMPLVTGRVRPPTTVISRDPFTVNTPPIVPQPIVPPSNSGGGSVLPAAQQRLLTVVGSSSPRPLIYGRTTLAGKIVYAHAVGSNLLVVYDIGEGPIQAINGATCNGNSLASYGVQTFVHLGTLTQGVDATVAAVNPTNWNSGRPGIAYVVAIFPPPDDTNAGLSPLNVIFEVSGRLVRDPRLDGSLVNRYYTTNPALHMADFLSASDFGAGNPDAYIDWAGTFTAAANDCEVQIGGGGNRYDHNAAYTQQATLGQMIDTIRGHCMGVLVWNEGLWKFYIDKAVAATGAVFTDDPANPARNMTGPPSVHLRTLAEVPTQVIIQFTNASKKYQDDTAMAELASVTGGTDSKRIKTYSLRGITVYDQAKRVANQILNRGQADKELTIRVFHDGGQVLPMDRITVNSVLTGISCDILVLDVKQDGMCWVIHGEIYSASTYSDSLQTNIPSAIPPLLNPGDPPGDIPVPSLIDVGVADLYWQASRLYSSQLWPTGNWSQLNLNGFDGSKVNDGISSVKAFDSAGSSEGVLTFDAGGGLTRTFGKVLISTVAPPSSQQTWLVEYSDDGLVWNAA
jgi:hypothetical protein